MSEETEINQEERLHKEDQVELKRFRKIITGRNAGNLDQDPVKLKGTPYQEVRLMDPHHTTIINTFNFRDDVAIALAVKHVKSFV